MRLRNKLIAFILLLSLVFTSKAFVVFAESESTVSTEESETVEDIETISETDMTEDIEAIEEIGPTEESKSEDETESKPETEMEEETETTEETETIEEAETTEEVEATEEVETTEETETAEETEAVEETETETESVVNDKLLGASDPKFRFAYFKEDMSVGLYTFDYVGFSVIPDSVTIAANQLGDLVYPEKRYNGAVDLGFENYNIGWLEENYKWDDSRIYSESPMSLSDAYRNWCTGSTIEDELYCANYAKLSEITLVKNTIDTEYYMGEKFSPDGLKVNVKFANNKTAAIDYSDSTKSHFKFYDNDTGAEYTTDTDVNANFTLKIVYGDVEHGSSAISTVSATIDIVALDPTAEKGFRVYCQKTG